ncbi:MAG: prepilin-type N-terminal cleavage/methylation domain-containing protein [Candidatus Omnitrophota bacterium]
MRKFKKLKKTTAFTPLEKVIRKPYSLTGFTLIELLVVIVIVVILAGIAIPNYGKAKEHALGKEAQANLKLIAAAEKIYRMEQGSYIDCDDASECNNELKLDLKDDNWAYSVSTSYPFVPVGGISPATARADRQSGSYSDCYYTMSTDDTEPAGHGCP